MASAIALGWPKPADMTDHCAVVSGSFRSLLLFDIAEEIDLALLRSVLGIAESKREPAFRHPTPEYVRFERPPVVEPLQPCRTEDGSELQTRIRYFDYGVASVELALPFQTSWEGLVRVANRWIMSPEVERRAHQLLRERLPGIKQVLKKPYADWISEDYYLIQIDPIRPESCAIISAEELVRERGALIAQIVRGEEAPLSSSERQEVLQSSLSYYPTDLLVVGWVAALVYDSPASASATIDLLEYANSQLLEFRYYDEVLTRVLADVYKRLAEKRGFWGQWKLAREAASLNTIRLDYGELVERTENAIKFLSDMFYARAYRLAADRIGVGDYRNLVTDKLRTARDLYESMVNEFHQARAFLLELSVVIILVIEIVFLFRGKA
ncbi:MAG: hypothetical protein JO033_26110 [Acidobacteriaceae bacterium]|nr:hypothetical protein [Acidobacteriaceae bacterium]